MLAKINSSREANKKTFMSEALVVDPSLDNRHKNDSKHLMNHASSFKLGFVPPNDTKQKVHTTKLNE